MRSTKTQPPGSMLTSLTEVDPAFLTPVEITVIYPDTDLAGLDENRLYLAVLDETSAEWLDAAATCPSGGSVVRFPQENRIVVTTCAQGEFALLGSPPGMLIYLPLISR